MATKNKELIHDLFIQGRSYKEIAVMINSNASAVSRRIQLYRKQEPDKWPRLKNYVEPLSIKVQVFKCSDCHVVFAIEKEIEFLNDVTCPFCWENKQVHDVGVSHLKINEFH